MGRRRNRSKHRAGQEPLGNLTNWKQGSLRTYRVGALPIINHLLRRMKLEQILREHLPTEDGRTKIATGRGLMVLIRNMLISREPLYGIRDWATQHPPDLLGLTPSEALAINDDRAGRWLTKFFAADPASIALAVTSHCIRQFKVCLDELHNDSTTVTFHGAYAAAGGPQRRFGRVTPAITFGHNKDHRPDLKQLLYILTVSRDGGVPVHFRVQSGNVTDDQTHCATWDVLCQLAQTSDFLYVADCKLATSENLAYIAGRGGRFVTVLPRTRKEDAQFRKRLIAGENAWRPLWDKVDMRGEVTDRFSVGDASTLTSEGYRLIWYHSTSKAELDASSRATRIRRAIQELTELRGKLQGPRSRYRDITKVESAVAEILKKYAVEGLLHVDVKKTQEEIFRQESPGRPGPDTRYVRSARDRFDLTCDINQEQLTREERADGVFPLVSNDRKLSELELLHVYKSQPVIEKRFEQLKTDYAIAPVWLKDVARIEALLGAYYLALMAEALIERELRRAMREEGSDSLPLYPEERPCRNPTTRRLIDIFDPVDRHEIHDRRETPTIAVTNLTTLQRHLLRLLGVPAANYGMPETSATV